jgi:DNA-directed RNA polymerase specialized sigma24 family protein
VATVPDDVLSTILTQAHRWAAGQGRTEEEREVAVDAATDAIVKALESFDPTRGDFGTWALLHVRPKVHQRIGRHRARFHGRPAVGQMPDEFDAEARDLPSAGRVPMTADLRDLPADLRDAVRFFYIDGFSLRDCGLLLGCSHHEVRARLAQAAGLLADQPAPGGNRLERG